ncbi:VOC family protein [Methanoplanus sp. FWC-SCC4]|uniref:VOC family protein n=1 Tax=Methanochimaera problematica TaxID=2609417 RepID=A0AA97F9Q2_9EURY|nr:VOC family protein [Methanoplanus sp. FWC-SCC4]WOF15415.1 VOC family protein [Methanoplanus sp. FWC-SCC4]
MLSDMVIVPTLPAVDLARAREFYEKKLGLKVSKSGSEDIFFECGKDSILYIYKHGATKADHTAAGFVVTDIEAEMKSLREKRYCFR